MSEHARVRARELQGGRAGFASRVVAAAIDIGVVLAAYELALVAWGIADALFTEQKFSLPTPDAWLSGTALLALVVLVLAGAWAGSGRTLGDALLGLRVIRENGADLGFPRALARGAVLVVLPFVSMGWILVSRKNAGLHDLVCRTTVIYDWRPRRAHPADTGARAAPGGAELAAASSNSRQDRYDFTP